MLLEFLSDYPVKSHKTCVCVRACVAIGQDGVRGTGGEWRYCSCAGSSPSHSADGLLLGQGESLTSLGASP